MTELKGQQIKSKLRSVGLELKDQGFKTEYVESIRGVPYIKVFIKEHRYHITFFGKHQFFRVFRATDSRNPHVDFSLEDEEAMFQYFFELLGGVRGFEEGAFVTTKPNMTLVERKKS